MQACGQQKLSGSSFAGDYIYLASLHVFIPDDWLLSDPNPAVERF